MWPGRSSYAPRGIEKAPTRRRYDRRQQSHSVASSAAGSSVARELAVLYEAMKHEGSAPSTKVSQASHWRYWEDFCDLLEIDMERFGCCEAAGSLPSVAQVSAEAAALSVFAVFVVFYPRKKGKDLNQANYAEQCLSSVRGHYEEKWGRRPGVGVQGESTRQMKLVLRGLHKRSPTCNQPRLPVLQQHLRAIKARMNLGTDQWHRTLWALWLTQWQRVCRSGDIIRPKSERGRAWNPGRDTHRGRIRFEERRDQVREVVGARLVFELKPTKTDQAGEKGFVKSFIFDANLAALSAADAIVGMLRGDEQAPGNLKEIPLFRNPVTGREVTYQESADKLKRLIGLAGYKEMATGLHCLRIGGATAAANDPTGGDIIAGFMGCWSSTARRDYMHAMRDRLEATAVSMARGIGGVLAQKGSSSQPLL